MSFEISAGCDPIHDEKPIDFGFVRKASEFEQYEAIMR